MKRISLATLASTLASMLAAMFALGGFATWDGATIDGLSGVARGQTPIARILPPQGIDVPAERRQQFDLQLERLWKQLESVAAHPLRPDAEVYLKAVDYALRHGEFYTDKDFPKADAALKQAEQRLTELAAGKTPWTDARGLVVRGYRSKLDDSVHPYGLVVPQDLDKSKPVTLYVWLHGRGDKQTDLHFVHERERSTGQISPPGALVLHPFGRHCLGFKSAGEIDVLEAIEHVKTQYSIDSNRIVLIGFSMGGAGAWHLGAHYADRWCAVSPGAGFAETAQYNKLTPDKFPPKYEQTLWGCYDVPAYVRNLFNVPVIAYSGEKDKQIQAAQIMEAAYRAEGRTLTHLIGPDVEHKYHPDTLKELMSRLAEVAAKGRDAQPRQVALQTRTLRYNRQFWVEATGLVEHWQDSRIDAAIDDAKVLKATTRNITSLRFTPPREVASIQIDDQSLAATSPIAAGRQVSLVRQADRWRIVAIDNPSTAAGSSAASAVPAAPAVPTSPGAATPVVKRPGLQGPIDDVFLEPFLVVEPSGQSKYPQVAEWVSAELNRFRQRWRALCRGELRTKRDVDVTPEDIRRYHLVLWGDAESNKLIQRVNGRLPINWPNGHVQVEDQQFTASRHVPALIYPNPLNADKYIVLNSGLTFRDSHDRTNSQQNPKLPDWAIIDVSRPADGERPGGIVLADFFNEQWELKRRPGS
ncbi:MAG TPA: prolyl oligopeptidase family serine peptidase, partial [Pirellulaceae bacterium]|nr:prolyl oligopeptidase family serine peptidase [Pirellulaceae bacterium]